MTSQRNLDLVGTFSTVRKRAKRTPDTIVETTSTKTFQDYIQPQRNTKFFEIRKEAIKINSNTKPIKLFTNSK